MTPISFPDIEGTFQAAMTEVLSPYLSSVNSQVLGGQLTHFSPMDIHYNIDQLKPAAKPRIVIVGTRMAEIINGRCGINRARRKRFSVSKSIYMSLPRSGAIVWNDEGVQKTIAPVWAVLQKAWTQASTIIHTQQTQFGNRGIINLRTSLSPVQVPNEEFFAYFAPLDCSIEVSYLVE